MLKDAIDLTTLRRVLVIKLRHHGDVLLTSPVFSVLKNHAPHLEIDALVYQDTAEMLSLHPAISQLHTIDRKWKSAGVFTQVRAEWELLSVLRARRYDLIVHLTGHPRGAWIRRLTGARYSVAPATAGVSQFWKSSFTHFFAMPKRGNSRHTVEVNLDALRRIGIHPTDDEKRLTLVPGAKADSAVADLLAQHDLAEKGFIHLHPASRWLFKCWPAERVVGLIAALQTRGHRIIVTAAPAAEELAMIKDIQAGLPQPIVDLSGQLSLKQLAALTARAQLFIGVDSAPMHIAAAMGTPTIALFGPSGEIEWRPWMTSHRLLTSDHSCRPCGNDGCGGSKVSDCLTFIPVKQVLDAIHEVLNDE
jgi:heptosyltransferase-3